MWEIELNSKQTKSKVVEPVGSKEKWYGNANEYWTVAMLLIRNLSLPIMEFLVDTVI